jgi:hypothetical protein
MLEQWLWPQLKGDFPWKLHLQQDGSLPLFHMAVRDFLNENLLEAWTGQAGPIPWAWRSPNLTPYYFYLLGYV